MAAQSENLVLIADDNDDARFTLQKVLEHNDYQVIACSSGQEALEQARERAPSLALLDVNMPRLSGFETVKQLKSDEVLRYVPVILVTARDRPEDIIQGLDCGADDYITKPYKPEELLARVRAAIRLRLLYSQLKHSIAKNDTYLSELASVHDYRQIIGKSTPIREVFSLIDKLSDSAAPVLITGASGTGKELVARAIHFRSERKSEIFLTRNCAAFSETLLESELFGHLRGAFTGALRDTRGLFEAADKGTLFLDEVGEMSQALQAKLLRVLEDGTFTPVGATAERTVDVRILAATNRDLNQMVKEGRFREDLYYRLNVVTVLLPSLAERKDDISLLVEHFLEKKAGERNAGKKTVPAEVMEALISYSWPGNVRELENEIERILILSRDETSINLSHLSQRILASTLDPVDDKKQSGNLRQAVEEVEKKLITEALAACSWNKSNAARELGISRSNLILKVQQYELSPERPSKYSKS